MQAISELEVETKQSLLKESRKREANTPSKPPQQQAGKSESAEKDEDSPVHAALVSSSEGSPAGSKRESSPETGKRSKNGSEAVSPGSDDE